jgi:hypothetical protein
MRGRGVSTMAMKEQQGAKKRIWSEGYRLKAESIFAKVLICPF